jgi:hypothetical protein
LVQPAWAARCVTAPSAGGAFCTTLEACATGVAECPPPRSQRTAGTTCSAFWGARLRKTGGSRHARQRLYLSQVVYTRRGETGTFADIQYARPVLDDATAHHGAVADERYWATARPVVHLCKLAFDEWTTEPLTQTWARYFPDVPVAKKATYAYPAPYSERFWRIYAEPIEDFVLAAHRLREAIEAATRALAGNGDLAREPGLSVGPQLLNAIVAPAGLELIPTDDGYEQRVVSPSLLGSMALMAQLDLAGQRRMIRCRNDKCRQLFVTNSYQTEYCSVRCKHASNKRRARARTLRTSRRGGVRRLINQHRADSLYEAGSLTERSLSTHRGRSASSRARPTTASIERTAGWHQPPEHARKRVLRTAGRSGAPPVARTN